MLAPDGSDSKQALVDYDWSSVDPESFTSEYFDHVEKFFGLKAYVFRQPVGDGGEIIETWWSRETGPIVLKQIIEKPSGDAIITETTSLEFRKVSDEEMKPRPELLIELPTQFRQQ